jgi:hypothetical protein
MKGCTNPGLLLSQEHCVAAPEDWDSIQKQQSRLSLLPSARSNIIA